MHETNETTVDQNAIAVRAYELFLSRGGEHGHADEDWSRAEQELRSTISRMMEQTPAPVAAAPAPAPAPAKAPAKPKKTTAAKASRKTKTTK
ncbi:MAG TPA: DUF2934 domain-containing protein [Polyangia bacterium]|jgi:lysozyme family protein